MHAHTQKPQIYLYYKYSKKHKKKHKNTLAARFQTLVKGSKQEFVLFTLLQLLTLLLLLVVMRICQPQMLWLL